MRILVVGGGGREHAIALAIAADDPSHLIYVLPGNPGTASFATNIPVPADDIDRVADAADMYAIDLTIVGPEVPLAMGLADRLLAEGRVVFGPTSGAAEIESSKAFAKDIMRAAGVPTAASQTFDNLHDALAYIDSHAEPLVVKASGLAGGKGAVVCETREAAREAAREMIGERRFGQASDLIVIEDFLIGEELSVLAVTNGHEVRILPPAQDHKRLLEGDRGPNTGGMGAYAPVRIATPEALARIEHEVLLPTLRELERRDVPFRGVLYAGLMMHPDGTPNVVEFNCRLGDPEAEVVLPLVASGLVDLLDAAARGRPLPTITVKEAAAVTTVLASEGYPDSPLKGSPIAIPDDLPVEVTVYHAGTTHRDDGTLVTSGGRVLAVTAIAKSFAEAQRMSADAAARIEFKGKQYRKDIGWRERGR